MAIKSVRKKLEGDYGDFVFGSGSRDVVYWFVEFDTIAATAFNCYGAVDPIDPTMAVPTIGAGLNGMVCTGVRPQRIGRSNIWLVMATYENPNYSGRSVTNPESNWNRTMAVRAAISQDDAQEGYEPTQNNGGPITSAKAALLYIASLNSAGDPYDPPLKQDLYDEEITITYYTTSDLIVPKLLNAFRGSINSTQVHFTINGIARDFDPKALKILDIQYSDVFDQRRNATTGLLEAFRAIMVVVICQWRESLWTRNVPDMGYYEIVSGVKRHISRNGTDVSQPAPLNGTGVALTLTSGTHAPIATRAIDLELALDHMVLFADITDSV